MQNYALNGRVALVTGCSRKQGIGYAVARRLAERGANLFLQGLARYDSDQYNTPDSDGPAAILAALRQQDTQVTYQSADFDDTTAPTRLMQAAVTEYGHVDILVANHAYSTLGALEDLTADAIDRHLQVNVRGTLLLVKAFAAQHTAERGGRVIMMTSGQHRGPMPGELAYIASKGALHQLTESLAAHLAPRGITVNTINPGATDTGYADEQTYTEVLQQQPMGRWGKPDDAARLIAWLATDDAHWITGQVIDSTGGGL